MKVTFEYTKTDDTRMLSMKFDVVMEDWTALDEIKVIAKDATYYVENFI